jgi:hypothetical protein
MTKFVRKIIFEFFFFKNRHSVYVLKLPQRTFKLIITRNFLIFSFLGGQFRPAWIRPDSRTGSADPVDSGSSVNPKHCSRKNHQTTKHSLRIPIACPSVSKTCFFHN